MDLAAVQRAMDELKAAKAEIAKLQQKRDDAASKVKLASSAVKTNRFLEKLNFLAHTIESAFVGIVCFFTIMFIFQSLQQIVRTGNGLFRPNLLGQPLQLHSQEQQQQQNISCWRRDNGASI